MDMMSMEMEQSTLEWLMEDAKVLEPLQPLSSDLLGNGDILSVSEDVEKLSKGQIADKLLAELDKLKDESEPHYDWLQSENVCQYPVLEDLPSSSSCKFYNTVKSNYTDPVSATSTYSPIYSQEDFVYTSKPVSYIPYFSPSSPEPYFSPSSPDFDTNLIHQPGVPISDETQHPLPSPSIPKDEDIFKLLEELKPDELEQLVRERVETLTESDMSARCSTHDEFSDYVSSPMVSSDSGMEDPLGSPCSGTHVVPGQAQKRKRTYTRSHNEEKKLRKKEQNKNAATRYRLKKKAEVEKVLEEEQVLAVKNKELHEQVNEISREIKYLKNLMREVYKAKGILK